MQMSHLLEIFCHRTAPPDLQLFWWVGQESLSLPRLPFTSLSSPEQWAWNTSWSWLTQDLVGTADWFRRCWELHTLFFKCDSRAIHVSSSGCPLEVQLPWQHTTLRPRSLLSLPWLPSICAVEQRNDLCSYLWNMAAALARIKSALLFLTPGCFNLTRYLFLNKYFFSVLGFITSSWSCIKQRKPQGRLVSLFGQLWNIWVDTRPKCLNWISSCLLDVQNTHFPFQTSHQFLALGHFSVSCLCVIICQKNDIPLVFRTLSSILVFLGEEKETPKPISITVLCMRPWESDWAQKGKLRSNVSKQREGLMNIEYWVIFKNCLPSSRVKTGRYIKGNWGVSCWVDACN